MARCSKCNIQTKTLRRGLCLKCEREEPKIINWKDCICGNKIVHTPECRRNHQTNIRLSSAKNRKQDRAERIKKHICTWGACNRKCKPVIIYHQYCEDHFKDNKEAQEGWRAKRKERAKQ